MSDNVYFASAGGQIKIGVSRNVEKRLHTIGAHLLERPVLLGVCPGTLNTEKEIHDRLEEFRSHGEWFRDCVEVRAVIAEFLGKPTRDWLFVNARALPVKRTEQRDPRVASLLSLAQSRWPKRTSAMMASVTGASVRACKYWLSGRNDPNARFQLALERELKGDERSAAAIERGAA